MSLVNGNDSVNGSNLNGSAGNNSWTTPQQSSTSSNNGNNVWDQDVTAASSSNTGASSGQSGNNNVSCSVPVTSATTVSAIGIAGQAGAISQPLDEPAVASSMSNLTIQDWKPSETEPGAASSSSPLSPNNAQISPEQPTGSASNAIGETMGEFERLTLQHLLKDDANLDLFSEGWGTGTIDHSKPWKIPANQANVPAQPSFVPIASSAKVSSIGGLEQQMHPQASAASAGNWRSGGQMNQAAGPIGANNSSGTDLWENSLHKGGARGPGPVMTPQDHNDLSHWGQSAAPSSHIGGTWGEEEENSNVWTGVPAANSSSGNWMGDDVKPDNKNNWNKPQSNWGDYDDKLDKGMAPWDRKSSNGSGSMLNGRNNEGSIGTWNSSMINNGVKKESNNWGDDSDCHGLGMAGAVDDGTNLWGGNKQSQHQSQSQMGQQHQRNNMRWNDDLGMNDGRMKTPNGPQNNMNNNMMMMSSGSGQFGGPTSPGRMMGNNMKPNGMNKANMNNQANNSNSWNNNDMNNANWNDYSKAGQIPSSGGNAHSKAGAGVWNDNASMHWNGHKNQNGGSVADSNEWSNSKRRMVNREMILSSNQYRILVEMGFKKEDVENALRTCNMNLEDTLEELRPISVREASFDADRQKAQFSHASGLPMMGGMGNRNNNPMMNQMGPGIGGGAGLHGNQSSLMRTGGPKHGQQHMSGMMPGNMTSNNNATNMNSMPSEKQLHHLVQQIQLAVRSGHLNAQILNQPLGLPTIQLIYQLLQQIKTLQQLQMQIQSNSNKPGQSSLLANLHIQVSQVRARITNLQSQIKFQQALFMNQQAGGNGNGCPSSQGQKVSAPSIVSQQQMLQNQLASSNNSPQLTQLSLNSPALDFKSLMLSDSQSNQLGDFRPPQPPPQQQQQQQQMEQSRLNQWKMNSFHNKDASSSLGQSNSGFSRAPGSLKSSNNSSNLAQSGSGSPLDMGPAASAWSSLGLDEPQSSGNSWSPSSPAGNNNSLANAFLDANSSDAFITSNAFTSVQDQVPEFQPGKPWKGSSQLKQFEDDPTLTPGNANASWARPNELAFQSSQTWAFGSLRGSDSSSSGPFKPSEWDSIGSSVNGATTSPGSSPIEQLWNRSDASLSKSRGPPPGMATGKSGKPEIVCEPNPMDSMDAVFGCGVIVMNLPPTADVFAMRRLFSQHGHVVAHFVKDDYVLFIYSSMDDAEKAQRALNFSVIHGKTILVKPASPAEMAMIMDCKKSAPPPQSFFGAQQMYLNGCSNEPQQQHAQQQHAQQHHVQQQQQQQPSPNTNGWMNNNMMPNNSNKWSFDNKPSNSGSIGNVLWAMGSNDRDPSNSASLQNLLPGDLLGESS